MTHFANVVDGVVECVIVAEQDFVDQLPGQWVQTSYNTHGGIHTLGGTPLRMNYAEVGGTYDAERDAFIPVKPFPSWILDEATCLWQPPVPAPSSPSVMWDEDSLSWVERPVE